MAGTFAASKVIDFLGDAVSAASNLNETISKTGVILGKESLPELERWAEAAADAFGLSKQQALDAASTFAVFGKSAGLAGQDLSGFSVDLTELASDLASFYNTSPEDAIVAIGAALRGESEPIRRYGVLLDDATLRQRALKLGIIQTTTQALTPQQRVLAAQAEIFAQTADAQGDFGRTSDGLAGSQKKLAAEFENIKVEIGQKLMPVVLEITHALTTLAHEASKVVGPAIEGVGFVIGRMVDGLRVVAGPLLLLKDGIDAVADSFDDGFSELPVIVERGVNASRKALADGGKAMVTEAAAVGEAIPKATADGILRAQQELADPIHQLLAFIESSLTPAQIIARDQGFLSSKAYANALASNDPLVRQKAQEMANSAKQEISNYQWAVTGGYNTGAAWVDAIANGIKAHIGNLVHAMGLVKAKTMGFSPPKEGPLKDIDKGGFNIGKAWLDGLNLGIGGKLALPGMPGLGSGSLGPMAGGASTVNNTWNLNLSGVPYQFKTRDDFIKALDDVSRFGGEGRLPNG